MARMLIVDDEPDLLALLCEIVEDAGHEVLGVSHANEVTVKGMVPGSDLVLVDLMLPDIDGITLARQLRRAGYRGPIVAMSASTERLQQAATSGLFQDSLRKPFDVDDLLVCVEHHTSAPLLRSQLDTDAQQRG